MNKFTLIVIVATAFAQEKPKCATAEELIESDFAEYKLKYKLTEDYNQNEDLTNAASIGHHKYCSNNFCYIQTGRDTIFKIEGVPETNDIPAGFRIYSEDKSKVFSFNQGAILTGNGYYMFDVDEEYISGQDYYYYTLLTYNGTHKELNYMHSDNKFYPLEVYKRATNNGTQIYRRGTPGARPMKFCFVKVKKPTAPIDDLCPAHKKLDAKVTCATAKDLIESDFAEYKLTYKFTAEYNQNDDLTKAAPIGFDVNDKNCGDNCCYIQTGRDTTFKIEGVPATNDTPASFRIYSADKRKMVSFNQGAILTGNGYYMFDIDKEYISGSDYYYYTLLTYNGIHKELNYMHSDNKFYPLEVYERTTKNGTQIYQRGNDRSNSTKFCFVKVKQPIALKCPIDDLVLALKKLDAKVTGTTCVAGADIESGKSCEAQCNFQKTGTPVTCTCDDGTWKAKVAAIECKATCKVDDLVSKLLKLDAEINDANCAHGVDIESGKGCKTNCKSLEKEADVMTYTCSDGTWRAPENIKWVTRKSQNASETFNPMQLTKATEAKNIACTSRKID